MRRWSVVLRGIALAGLPVSLAAAMAVEVGVLDGGHGLSSDGDARRDTALADPRTTAADRLWFGTEFARRWASVPEMPCDVRVPRLHPQRLDAVMDAMYRLNPAIRRRLVDHGGALVFFEGRLTEVVENRHLANVDRGLYSNRLSRWRESTGLYRPKSKVAFVAVDRGIPEAQHTLLHELGHMLDDALDRPSESEAFRRVTATDDEAGHLGYAEGIVDPFRKQREYFADSFAHLHESPAKRAWMRRERPAAARYFDDLLGSVIEDAHRALEREVDEELRARLVRAQLRALEPDQPPNR